MNLRFLRVSGALCHRPGVARERQDLLRELGILAAEMMSSANLLAPHVRRLQAWTYAVLLALPVNAQHGLVAEVCQLRPGRQARGAGRCPGTGMHRPNPDPGRSRGSS